MIKRKIFILLLMALTVTMAVRAQSNPDFDDVSVELTDDGVRLCWTAVDDALYYKVFERHGEHSFYFADSTYMTCFDGASYHPTKDNYYYVTAVFEDGHEITSDEVYIGFRALNFTVYDIHGGKFNLFETLDKGQFVFIDYFNYNCYNCREAIPYIVESYSRYGCNAGDVFYIEINANNNNDICLRWCEEFGVKFPTVSIEGGGLKFSNMYQITGAPHFILVAPDRSIVLDGGSSGFYIFDLQSIIDAFEPLGIRVKNCDEGLGETAADNGTLFPNPADGFVNMSLDGSNEIRVYNATGQLMGTYIVDSQQVSIETSHYPDGLYFVQVNGKAYGRFMVRH